MTLSPQKNRVITASWWAERDAGALAGDALLLTEQPGSAFLLRGAEGTIII